MIDQLTAEQLLTSIWAALRRIEDNLALPPAPLELPTINVAPPDLADIVTAVTSLKPGPTAEEIAAAIANTLSPARSQPDGTASLDAVAAALEKLDFRLKGMGAQAYGGGTVTIDPNTRIPVSGTVNVGNFPATQPVSGTVAVSNFPAEVEISNDSGSPIPVKQFGAMSASTTRVTSSATAVTLLAANSSRNQATIYNESTSTLYVKFGSGASATDYTLPVTGSGYYELPVRYVGIITGIWTIANGFAQVTEF